MPSVSPVRSRPAGPPHPRGRTRWRRPRRSPGSDDAGSLPTRRRLQQHRTARRGYPPRGHRCCSSLGRSSDGRSPRRGRCHGRRRPIRQASGQGFGQAVASREGARREGTDEGPGAAGQAAASGRGGACARGQPGGPLGPDRRHRADGRSRAVRQPRDGVRRDRTHVAGPGGPDLLEGIRQGIDGRPEGRGQSRGGLPLERNERKAPIDQAPQNRVETIRRLTRSRP
jgi:hypothetical protein